MIYRASIAEMVVPYADPSPVRFWQNYFDTGEYLFGRYTNSLELGCDCLGEIHYFDATIADEDGAPAGHHERDLPARGGLRRAVEAHRHVQPAWPRPGGQRRLVISFFLTIGNYDYGFYWYLYLDGTIQLEVKATGIVFTSAYRGADGRTPPRSRPGSVRRSTSTCSPRGSTWRSTAMRNAVDEVDAVPVPMGPDNPYGNAFTPPDDPADHASPRRSATRRQRSGRVWHIVNPTKHEPARPARRLRAASRGPADAAGRPDVVDRRARRVRHQAPVGHPVRPGRALPGRRLRQPAPGRRRPAGVRRAATGRIDGEDIVLWHTFGLTHFPRPEDWPVMPVDYAGFTLKPVGFFDRNPALDVPASTTSHCCAE